MAAFLTEAAPVRWAAAPRRPPPPAALIRIATRCPRDLAGLRDRALLLLAAGGLGRTALVGPDVEHIRFTAAGAELSAHPAGVDGAAEHARVGAEHARERTTIVIPRGTRLAVCAVQVWATGSTAPTRGSDRCSGKPIAGARSNTTASAPMRSAASSRPDPVPYSYHAGKIDFAA